jgi:hypothetical protein
MGEQRFQLFRPINTDADYDMHKRVKAARKLRERQCGNRLGIIDLFAVSF